MKRKIFDVLLGLLLVVSLVACGENAVEDSTLAKGQINLINSGTMNVRPDSESAEDVVTEVAEPIMDHDVLGAEASGEEVWVNNNIYVRSGPGTGYEIVGTLDYGDTTTRIGTDGSWSQIIYNGTIAYVYAPLLQTNEIVKPDDVASTENSTTSVPETEQTASTNYLCVGEAKEIYDRVNAEREAAGLAPLEWSDELAAAAAVRSEEIVTVMSHTRPDGTSCLTVSPIAVAENIMRGPHCSSDVKMDGWMNSEGHRKNILYPTLGKIGVAVNCTSRGDTAVQLFGW